MQANRRWGFFDGKSARPAPKDPSNILDEELGGYGKMGLR